MQLATDSQSRYFINRDPEYFLYVLDYYRNGVVLPANMPHPSDPKYARIRQEFDYFLPGNTLFPDRSRPTIVEAMAEGNFKIQTLESSLPPQQRMSVCVYIIGMHTVFTAIFWQSTYTPELAGKM